MPVVPWTPEQGLDLVRRKQISQDSFNMAYPDFQQPQPEMSMETEAPAMPFGMPPPPVEAMPAAPEPMPPPTQAPPPMNQGDLLTQAYGANYGTPIAPEVTTTDGLGERDKAVTRAYATAYGTGYSDEPVPQQAYAVTPPTDGVAQNASYDPNGPGLIEPAVPGEGAVPAQPDYMQQIMQQYGSPYDDSINAMGELSRSLDANAKEESDFLRIQQREYQKQVADNMKADQDRQKQIDDQFQKLTKAQADLESKKVDPDRFWANKDTGQKILAGVAMIVGGFGAAKTGENLAVKVINDAITRDIDQQRFDIKNAQDSVSQKRGVFNDMMSLFKDERTAREASVAHGLQAAEMRLKSIAARTKNLTNQQSLVVAVGELRQKRMESLEKVKTSLARNVFMASMAQGKPMTPQAMQMMSPEDRERAVGIPGKFYGFAYSKEGAQKIRDQVKDIEGGRNALNDLIEIANGSRIGKLSPALQAKAGTIRGSLMGKLRLALIGPGAVTPEEWKRLEEIIADPAKIASLGNEVLRLTELRKMVDYGWEQELNANGLMLPENAVLNSLGGRKLKK